MTLPWPSQVAKEQNPEKDKAKMYMYSSAYIISSPAIKLLRFNEITANKCAKYNVLYTSVLSSREVFGLIHSSVSFLPFFKLFAFKLFSARAVFAFFAYMLKK